MHQNNSNPKKKISNNEKKEIVKNIIDRLYKDSKYGTMNNSFGCNKYIKSVQGSTTNLNIIEAKTKNCQDYNSDD